MFSCRRAPANLVVAIALIVSMCRCAAAQDWPQWRGSDGDGAVKGWKLATSNLAGPLPAKWETRVGAGYSGLAVVGDRLFTMDRVTQPQEAERIICLSAGSGELVWSHSYPVQYGQMPYGSGPRATPTVSDGLVFALGATGVACCLAADSGRVVWSRNFVAEESAEIPEWGFASSPLVVGESVVLHVGASPGGCYVALDRRSGKELWRQGDEAAGYSSPILKQAGQEPVIICWTPKSMRGLSPGDGAVVWELPLVVVNGPVVTPVFDDGVVLFSSYLEGARAVSLRGLAAGKEPSILWQSHGGTSSSTSQPLLRNGYAYVLDKSQGLTCVAVDSGERKWGRVLAATSGDAGGHASMVWIGNGDDAAILNSDGELVLCRLNPQGYEELFRAKLVRSTPVWAHPAFASRSIFARGGSRIIRVALPVE